MTDPFAVLGLPPGASPRQVRAARLALVKHLHPDGRWAEDPESRARAERRLAEVNAAYDAVVARWRAADLEEAPVESVVEPEVEAVVEPEVEAVVEPEVEAVVEPEVEVVVDAEPPPRLSSFAVGAFRPVAFEAIVVASADVGDVTDADEPFSLELFVEGPPRGFCRLELFPEAGGSVVTAESDHVDPVAVCTMLVLALNRLGLEAQLLPA